MGGALSAADLAAALFFSAMRMRPDQPDWPEPGLLRALGRPQGHGPLRLAGRPRRHRGAGARHLRELRQPAARPPGHAQAPGGGGVHRRPRARTAPGRRHGAGPAPRRPPVPRLCAHGRRGAGRGLDLGGGGGGQPPPALQPGGDRGPQRPPDLRPHRGGDALRAAPRALARLRVGGPAHRRPRPPADPEDPGGGALPPGPAQHDRRRHRQVARGGLHGGEGGVPLLEAPGRPSWPGPSRSSRRQRGYRHEARRPDRSPEALRRGADGPGGAPPRAGGAERRQLVRLRAHRLQEAGTRTATSSSGSWSRA